MLNTIIDSFFKRFFHKKSINKLYFFVVKYIFIKIFKGHEYMNKVVFPKVKMILWGTKLIGRLINVSISLVRISTTIAFYQLILKKLV